MDRQRKAFVCHASEDKDRFVLEFGRYLRARGIDAWVDRWEIMVGDSIVERIFGEGIKNADAMIVVLSSYSVLKPWVREELSVGVVKRIEEGIKIIPVVLDNCEIPESLKAIRRIRIADLSSYEAELAEIVRAIHGVYEKPPLGSTPAYARTTVDALPGLSRVDSIVMKVLGDAAIEVGNRWIDGNDIMARCAPFDMDLPAVRDALKVLEERGYVVPGWSSGPNLPSVEVTVLGFDLYANTQVDGYKGIVDRIVGTIANVAESSNASVAHSLGVPMRVVDHVLDVLKSRRLIKFSASFGGYEHRIVFDVSPTIKRLGQ